MLKLLEAVYLSPTGMSMCQQCLQLSFDMADRAKFVFFDRLRRGFSPNFPERGEDAELMLVFLPLSLFNHFPLVDVN